MAGHNDRIRLNALLDTASLQQDYEEVRIEISGNGESSWLITHTFLSEQVLKAIVELCLFQEKRMHKEASDIVSKAAKGQPYSLGMYTLGTNFP